MIAIVAFNCNIYAQYASDGLRFSQTNFGSTARFKAMGNAQIGLGGDISSLGGNPAGLGLFTKSEFSFTPEFNTNKANTSYLGDRTNSDKSHANINQLGAVFFTPVYKQKGEEVTKGLVSAVFGLGYNRNNDYNTQLNYGGTNGQTSITDNFAQLGGSITPDKLAKGSLERMAYDNYLISYDPLLKNYYSETFVDQTKNQFNKQSNNTLSSGSVSEFNFSGALNFSNQIYIGASLGLVDIKYNKDSQFEEAGKLHIADQAITATKNYKLIFFQNQTTKGAGVNGRLGIIFRPEKNFRLGATLQTPTWFVIDDSYTEGLDNRGTLSGTTANQTYDFTYNLRTPLKGALGASYIIANQAIITADIDFIDYASIKFSTNENFAATDDINVIKDNNTQVRQNYRNAINYRVGAEYKMDKISLRAGYGLNGSPYKTDEAKVFETKTYSGGLGYRVKNYFFDLTYQKIEGNSRFSLYTLNAGNEPVATTQNETNNIFLTFGLRF